MASNEWSSATNAFDVLKDGAFRVGRYGGEKNEKSFLNKLQAALEEREIETVADTILFTSDMIAFLVFCRMTGLEPEIVLQLSKSRSVAVEDQLNGKLIDARGSEGKTIKMAARLFEGNAANFKSMPGEDL